MLCRTGNHQVSGKAAGAENLHLIRDLSQLRPNEGKSVIPE